MGLPFISFSWQTRDQRLLFGLSGAFVVALLLATIASDVRFMSVFGVHGRNTGFLSYLALLSLFLFFVTRKNSENFYVAAIAFAVITNYYCRCIPKQKNANFVILMLEPKFLAGRVPI
ncbi:MAG: hypothetical protein EBU84_04800 [Actinobacteria bacterium]|nr:hypothetical protein [Actinomycetota bacterium]